MEAERKEPLRLCVFCGSKLGDRGEYAEAARALAVHAVQRGWQLVYGGGSVGLMGVLADAALAAGGTVYGVIPERLASDELAHRGITELFVVRSMHERKARMMALASAFAALPGGFGTLEELFEVVSWAQLGIHRCPIGLLNTSGYYDRLVQFVDHAVAEGFIKPIHRELIIVRECPEELIATLERAIPPMLPQRLSAEET